MVNLDREQPERAGGTTASADPCSVPHSDRRLRYQVPVWGYGILSLVTLDEALTVRRKPAADSGGATHSVEGREETLEQMHQRYEESP